MRLSLAPYHLEQAGRGARREGMHMRVDFGHVVEILRIQLGVVLLEGSVELCVKCKDTSGDVEASMCPCARGSILHGLTHLSEMTTELLQIEGWGVTSGDDPAAHGEMLHRASGLDSVAREELSTETYGAMESSCGGEVLVWTVCLVYRHPLEGDVVEHILTIRLSHAGHGLLIGHVVGGVRVGSQKQSLERMHRRAGRGAAGSETMVARRSSKGLASRESLATAGR
mmetsp:Transcript_53821/g.127045  ORF Transcript_53821/g.127045 Transcript_53821/m.127045 type:complete len:227 (-) Transcript_53821:73-753(-)